MKFAKVLCSFLVGVMLLALVRPAMADTTDVDLVNSTGKFIWVDWVQGIAVQHKGMFAPGSTVSIRLGIKDVAFFTYVHVYVKSHDTDAASATICYTTKAFGNSSKTYTAPTIVEHIRFEDGKCSIS
ncbi:MAG TPA: hypothetical protein VMS32_10490 [Verrucomicrobiae bacterium]|jgi:hypothetical protein|nr:hypothetical protein [Verrucomicrobiae bacterium]